MVGMVFFSGMGEVGQLNRFLDTVDRFALIIETSSWISIWLTQVKFGEFGVSLLIKKIG